MKISALLFLAVVAATNVAHAEVEVEQTCWTHVSRGKTDRDIAFVMRTYKDTELNKEVGAVIQYAGSKETIPLVFENFQTDLDDPDSGNYELARIEVVNGKAGGEYVFSQTGQGIKQGKGVAYKKSKTSKPILFFYTPESLAKCPFPKPQK
ncbi:hypothetical protein [Massilia luteola]|jgi:hypothetical protein|uniref:hypothetical protein n=1 Tax=Massilia luteola TaxID=3081751 RepID=UPI002ACC3335|nr:hypothetical protein [Massilia sp. Gc5]